MTGRSKFSKEWLIPVSTWLGIAPPAFGLKPEAALLMEEAAELDADEINSLILVAKQIKASKNKNKRH